jgi:hypothetical protein
VRRCAKSIVLVALLAFAAVALIAAPAQAANRAKLGQVCSPEGQAAGQCINPTGLAVNRTGAGGVAPGDFYVVDRGNKRIDEFTAAGAFVRTFGYDVVAPSSPADNVTPVSAVQKVEVPAAVSAGIFTLSFNGQTTGGSATATLTAASNIVGALITAKGTGTTTINSPTVTGLSTTVGKFIVGQPISGTGIPVGTTVASVSGTTLTLSANATASGAGVELTSNGPRPFAVGQTITGAGIPAGTTIAAASAGSLTLSAAAESSGTLVALKSGLAFNAAAAQVQTALQGLSTIGSGNATVSGGPGATAPYAVTFAGALANLPVPLLSADSTGLTGGSVAASVTTPGVSPLEVCNVAEHPTDVCKEGTASNTLAGALAATTVGIAVDQATGNVYVNATITRRIDVYSAKGAFQGSFGVGVKLGDIAPFSLDFCTAGTGCLQSAAAGTAGAFGASGGNTRNLAVGPSNGHLYVPDPANRRLQEFSPTLNGSGEVLGASFVRAIGFDVAPGAVNEQQEVQVKAAAGNYTLSFGSGAGSTTGNLSATATASTVETALNALTTIAPGSVTVSGGPGDAGGSSPYLVEFTGSLAATNVQSLLAANVSLSGGSPSSAATVATRANGAAAGTGLETCTTASTCKEGAAAANGAGQFLAESPLGVAVDSSGDIYAVNVPGGGTCSGTETCRVEKFNSDGSLNNNEFGPGAGAECKLTQTSGNKRDVGTLAVAVDPTNQHLLALKKTAEKGARICELESGGAEVGIFPPLPALSTGGEQRTGLAVGPGERVYAVESGAGVPTVYILGPVPPPSAEILPPAEEITATSAKLKGKVTVPAPGGPGFETTYRFEYSADNGFNWTKFPASDSGLGNGSAGGASSSCPTPEALVCTVSQTVTELQPNLNYLFRLVATTGPSVTTPTEHFTTLAAKPTVSKTIALPVTGTAAKLNAAVNPNNSPTTYHFEWGPCATPATCSASPYPNQAPDFEPFAGSGGGALPVSVKIAGLTLASTYHFRLLASNAAGTTFGPEATFTTSAFEGLNAAGLPDNRAIELVSPPDKRPQGAVEGFIIDDQVDFQAAADGGSVLFPVLSGLGDTGVGGSVRYRAARSEAGWQSARVSPDSTVPGLNENVVPSSLVYSTPDLACQRVETFNPVTADTPPADVELGVTNLYLRKTDGSYTLISNAVPANPTLPDPRNYYTVGGASPDCGRVIFQTPYKLLPGAPSGLYEWDHGTLRDAGLRPDGSAAPDTGIGALGGHGGFYRDDSAVNAVGPDGRRLFFNATSDEVSDSGSPAVFVRKGPQPGETAEASQKQAGGANENNGAYYQTASPDGKHLFFVANYGLTTSAAGLPTSCRPGSSSQHQQGLNGEGCDLYDYEVENPVTHLPKLTDLSATTDPANPKGAEVQGVVAVSEKGDYIYFAARGRLVPGQGNTYAQNHVGEGFTNIYLAHGGALAYVATIRFADLSQRNLLGGGTDSGNLMVQAESRTSQATPDGRHLLFTSRADITGYPAGDVPQAYLYSADSGATVCVSCRPDGQPSVGNFFTMPIRSALTEPEQHYRIPRSLSADGSRVFFRMPDALAPGAVESPWPGSTLGKTNLYEWEQGQVYFLATFDNEFEGFQDSGASGRDVFVQSPDRLDPRYDVDTVRDLYDLRAGGGFPDPPPPPVPCDVAGSECQGPAEPGLAPLVPRGSAIATDPGNPPPPPAQCPKGKVRRNGKCVKKHHKKHPKRHNSRAANTHNGGAK